MCIRLDTKIQNNFNTTAFQPIILPFALREGYKWKSFCEERIKDWNG